MKPRIIIDANIPYIRGAFDDVAEVEYLVAKDITHDKAMNADALIVRTRTRCNAALLEGSRVKIVATATIGIDHIDTEYCDTHNIQWTNAPGCNAESVAQWVGSALAVWANEHNYSLVGKTIGIVGHGHVGKRVERLAHKLGMNVLLNDPPLALENPDKYVDLHTIARECDVITFHTPLTREGKFPTYHLADEEFFEIIKKRNKSLTENISSHTETTELTEGVLLRSPLIINAARGGIINENALLSHLSQLSNIAIDCWDGEPETNSELREKAIIATPHIAGYSADGKYNASQQVIEAVAKALNITPNTIEGLSEKKTTDKEGDELKDELLNNYNILVDSDALKAEPEKFEHFRSNYPTRRELRIKNMFSCLHV
ncbi:MAG: 4-phosphoerythronate dehydrogenase [Paludibacteraceae bacterium]|nr:4-phosphoerythronate dehydrogenase [Paludibacteraceae bacterium]